MTKYIENSYQKECSELTLSPRINKFKSGDTTRNDVSLSDIKGTQKSIERMKKGRSDSIEQKQITTLRNTDIYANNFVYSNFVKRSKS